MNDLINRQMAIDAVLSIGHTAKLTDGDAVVRMSAVNHVLRNLPSTQPKIIRCKECKRQDTDNVFRSMWCYEMHTFVKPNEFCSRADMRGGNA